MDIVKRLQDSACGNYAAEAVFFLFKIGEAMLDPSVRLYIYQSVCENEYPLGLSCYTLHSFPEREDHIQQLSATYTMAYKILLNTPVIVLALFCGAWSDRIGRKLPVILACTGTIFAVLLFMVSMMANAPRLPLVLCGAAVRGLFGKSAIVTMALHSYISDISSKEERTRRIGMLLAMNFFGFFVGSLLTGALLQVSTFDVIFCAVVAINACCVIIVMTFMRESLPELTVDTGTIKTKLRNPFSVQHVRESLDVILRGRENNARYYLWFFFLCVIIHQVCKSGEVDVTLLYTKRSPLDWSKATYGYLLATDYACLGLSVLIILPLLVTYLKPHDLTLVALGIGFKVVRLVVLTFADHTWLVFFSVVIGSPSAMITSGAKSLISKTVEEGEIGKAFSLLSCMETLSNVLGSVIFNNVYAATTAVFPGFTFAMDAVFHTALLGVTIFLAQELHHKAQCNLLEDLTSGKKHYGSTPIGNTTLRPLETLREGPDKGRTLGIIHPDSKANVQDKKGEDNIGCDIWPEKSSETELEVMTEGVDDVNPTNRSLNEKTLLLPHNSTSATLPMEERQPKATF